MLRWLKIIHLEDDNMPEFRFKNPSLQAIYHSLMRMNQRMDFFIFKLFFFFDKNRRLIMQDPTVNATRESSDDSTYVNPISYKSFSELENPVLDSEGYVREKNEKQVNLGIYSRQPVKIINSTDLNKIQTDCRSLETKMDALILRMDAIITASDNDRQRWEKEKQESERKWQQKERKWDEKEKKWAAKEKKWDEERAKWENERTQWQTENQSIKNEIKVLKTQNEKFNVQIKEKDTKIHELQNNSWNLSDSDTDYSDNEEVQVSKSAPQLRFKTPHNLPDEAKWQNRNTFLGIKQTFFSHEYKEEKKGDDLRLAAYHGKTKSFEWSLNRNKTLVNSRGLSDAFHSVWLKMDDKTSLMIACQHGSLDIVKRLVEEGAHVNFLDRKRRTALDYAELHHQHDITDFLKDKGAKNGHELKEVFEDVPSNSQSLPVLIRPTR